MNKENLELAEEHIKIAADLVEKEAIDVDGDKQDILKKAVFDLEKAEAEVNDGSA